MTSTGMWFAELGPDLLTSGGRVKPGLQPLG